MKLFRQANWPLIVAALLVVLLAGLIACAAPQRVPAGTAPTAPAPPRLFPDIDALTARVLVQGGQVTDTVIVSVGSPGLETSFDWSGEFVYYLDAEPPTGTDESALTAEGTYKVSVEPSITWEGVEPGEHIFSVQLVDRDRTPLDVPVIATVAFPVPTPGSPSPAVQALTVSILCRVGYVPPGMGAPLLPTADFACGEVNVSPQVRNFRVSAENIGQPPTPGEGHYIYYFGAEPPTTPGQEALTEPGTYVITADSTITWTAVEPGQYTIWVQLVNNDNTPLEPPVVARAEVVVAEDAQRF